jgi:hypothetical protein
LRPVDRRDRVAVALSAAAVALAVGFAIIG